MNREGQVIGMAGALLAAEQALAIAREGRADPVASALVIGAVGRIDAPDPASVYGDVIALGPALERLHAFMETGKRDPILVRTLVVLVQLERVFSADAEAPQRVASGIRALQDIPEADRIAELGRLYSEAVSPLSPRVMIPGDPQLLSRPTIVAQVRAHLLASLRGVVLWRQMGGTRLRLWLGWNALSRECQRLREIAAAP